MTGNRDSSELIKYKSLINATPSGATGEAAWEEEEDEQQQGQDAMHDMRMEGTKGEGDSWQRWERQTRGGGR